MTPAERQKAYRVGHEAAGMVVRRVDREAQGDARLDVAERERYRNALRDSEYLKNEVERLRIENDRLKVELAKETQFHLITTKELIGMRNALRT